MTDVPTHNVGDEGAGVRPVPELLGTGWAFKPGDRVMHVTKAHLKTGTVRDYDGYRVEVRWDIHGTRCHTHDFIALAEEATS